MSKAAYNGGNETTIAVLHPAGGRWRAVAVRRENGGLKLLGSREFRADEAAEVEAWLDQLLVSRTICVLPGSAVICRTASLPDAGRDQMLAALELQAESFMPRSVPKHRRAVAILPSAEDEPARSGLVIAWPEKTAGPELPISRPMDYVPDAGCLAALLNGSRPAQPVVTVDRETSSVAIAMTHAQGAVLRASREDADTRREWINDVRRFVVETALAVGHSDTYASTVSSEVGEWLERLGTETAGLLVPEEVVAAARTRMHDAPDDPAWWSQYGVALGGALATLGELAPVTRIQRDVPIENPSILNRVFDRLSTRRAAAMWVIAAILLAGFGPLIVSGMRLGLLKWKVGDLAAYRDAQRVRESKILLYDELQKRTWPMAKLLADVVNAAPQGVVIESIILDEGDNTLDIRGQAETDQQILEMRRKLTDTSIFESVTPQYDNRDQRNATLSFTMNGTVAAGEAFRRVTYQDDFATNPLKVRLYGDRAWTAEERQRLASAQGGDGGSLTASDVGERSRPAGNGGGGGDNGSRSSTPPDGVSRDEFGGRTEARSSRPGPRVPMLNDEPPEMPKLLTPEEISELPRENVQPLLLKLVNSRKDPAYTEEQRAQMEEQFELLMNRMRETSHFDD